MCLYRCIDWFLLTVRQRLPLKQEMKKKKYQRDKRQQKKKRNRNQTKHNLKRIYTFGNKFVNIRFEIKFKENCVRYISMDANFISMIQKKDSCDEFVVFFEFQMM